MISAMKCQYIKLEIDSVPLNTAAISQVKIEISKEKVEFYRTKSGIKNDWFLSLVAWFENHNFLSQSREKFPISKFKTIYTPIPDALCTLLLVLRRANVVVVSSSCYCSLPLPLPFPFCTYYLCTHTLTFLNEYILKWMWRQISMKYTQTAHNTLCLQWKRHCKFVQALNLLRTRTKGINQQMNATSSREKKKKRQIKCRQLNWANHVRNELSESVGWTI